MEVRGTHRSAVHESSPSGTDGGVRWKLVVNGADEARVHYPGDESWQTQILIVDDEAMIRALLPKILSQEGYDVIASEDG